MRAWPLASFKPSVSVAGLYNNQKLAKMDSYAQYIRYHTIEEINVDSKAEYTA